MTPLNNPHEGILLINKPAGITSFNLVASLRKLLGVRKIGHAGTLDPFATGVMVMLIGRNFTKLSDQFLGCNKEYLATIRLGISTDSFDCDGQVLKECNQVPPLDAVLEALTSFQGEVDQIPPMFSAKKIQGKKMYELARAGKTVERKAVRVRLKTEFVEYNYPYLKIKVECSKGTYIRSIAEDLGNMLGSGGHLTELIRLRSGDFHLEQCLDGKLLKSSGLDLGLLTSSLLNPTIG